MEIKPKRELSDPEFMTVQHVYRHWGKAASVLMPATTLANLLTAVLARRRRLPALMTAFAALCTAVTVGIWAKFNEPVNQDGATWPERGIPVDWEQKRDQWEFAHATSAAVHTLGMGELVVATLRDREPAT